MPRRSGAITVWSLARVTASGCHMSPVSPKPCSSSTAGPWPPKRTWIVAPSVLISRTWKLAGNGATAAATGAAMAMAAQAPTRRLRIMA